MSPEVAKGVRLATCIVRRGADRFDLLIVAEVHEFGRSKTFRGWVPASLSLGLVMVPSGAVTMTARWWSDPSAMSFSIEEVLCKGLSEALIAFGYSREFLPPLGASRSYISSGWQTEVARKVETAGIICIAVGKSTSLLWLIFYS